MPTTNDLWAITSFFNPAGYGRRLSNFREFRKRLNVPLVAAELAYGGDFELSADDADIVIQFRSKDVMWQKERLLNLALARVPKVCRSVAWLDCEVIFERPDWAAEASRVLEKHPLIQPFERFYDLEKDVLPEQAPTVDESLHPECIAKTWQDGLATEEVFLALERMPNGRPKSILGGAWAGRRELFDRHGFWDTAISGGGDQAFVAAACGKLDSAIKRHYMHPAQRKHFLDWAAPFFDDVRGNISYLNGIAYHLWHGDLVSRKFLKRFAEFEPFQFNPYEDIQRDANDCWRWSSPKPEMHRYVREYFLSRKEDGA